MQGGKEFAQRVGELRENGVVVVVAWLDGRAEVIRRTTSAEGQAIVGGALTVDEQVAFVVESREAAKSVVLPPRIR